MRRCLFYLLIGFFFLLVQSSVFPLFLSAAWRPDLTLILMMILAVRETPSRALIAALLLGAAHDSLSASTIGLHVCVYLILLMLIRFLAEKLNVESPPLFILMILGGTLIQSVLIGFVLVALADASAVVFLLGAALPRQLLSNLLAAIVLLTVFSSVLPATSHRHIAASRSYGEPL